MTLNIREKLLTSKVRGTHKCAAAVGVSSRYQNKRLILGNDEVHLLVTTAEQIANDCLPVLIYLWSATTWCIAGLYFELRFGFPQVGLIGRAAWRYPEDVAGDCASDGTALVDGHRGEPVHDIAAANRAAIC